MKKFKLTKGIQTILITLFVIIVGAVIVGRMSNDEAMAYSAGQSCPGNLNGDGCPYSGVLNVARYDDARHQLKCFSCGFVAQIDNCTYSTENPVAKSTNNENTHYWYATCTACYGTKSTSYSSGTCYNDAEGDCFYCERDDYDGEAPGGSAESGTCNPCTSYDEVFIEKDDELHSCYRVCTTCGNQWYDADYIHKYESYTDNGNGTHTANCKKNCGYTLVEDHTFENGVCTETGCGATEECEHVEEEIPAVSATCTTAGSTAGVKCSICDEILTQPTEIEATGHTEEEIPAVEATCTTAGSTTGVKCSVCDEVLTEPTPVEATGHTEETIPTVEATCTTAGSTAGVKCSVCDEVLTEPTTIEATGHTEEEIPAVEATCTTAGSTAGVKCSVCDETITEPTTIEATGHTEETIPAVEPTCTTAGSTAGVQCSVCDETITEPTTIEATGHTEETIPAVEATCTTAGSTAGVQCSVCDETITEPTPIDATGHSYENGECTDCGQKDPQVENALVITSETYTISGEYITKVQPGTTVSELKTNLSTNAVEIKIYNSDNEELSSSDKIGTGTRIELTKGEETKTFTIIVIGDANGDAEADFKDIVKINQARLNRTTLEEIYALAADVNNDGEVDFKDLVKINRFRLNKITEL